MDGFKLNRVTPILEEEDMILPPPFDKLPTLVRYVTHNTDTFFLDYTPEDWPYHFWWSEQNFNRLKKEWQVAQRINNEVYELTDWLVKNPDQLEKVWTILKMAHHRSLDS